MINKIKEILNILSNNIEKYHVEIYKGKYYFEENNPIPYYSVNFYKDEKWYYLEFKEKTLYIRINTKICSNIGGTYEIIIPSNEMLPINLILDTMILRGRNYVENQILKLEL